MRVKVFELRDEGTHIGIFAMSTEPSPGQEYELQRCGFQSGDAVIVGYLDGERNSSADPYHWNCGTMRPAHLHITKHFNDLQDGQVIDARVLRGETKTPCESDQFYRWMA